MTVLSKIRGTIETIFRIGIGGPQLKNDVGEIDARNAADTAFVNVRGADPVINDDLATKRYVDGHVPPTLPQSIITWQPGGVGTVAPVYANWSDVQAALAAVEMNAILIVDSSLGSATVPSTAQFDSLGRLQIVGAGVDNLTSLDFADGAQIKNLRSLTSVAIAGTNPTVRSPLYYDLGNIEVLFQNCLIEGNSGTLAIVEISDAAGLVNMRLDDTQLRGFVGHPAIHITGFADLELQGTNYTVTVPVTDWANTISGDAGTTLNLYLDAGYDPAITAGGGGTLPAYLGSFAVIQSNFAQGVEYSPDKPNFWANPAPTQTKAALDRLAAAVYALRGNVPIP